MDFPFFSFKACVESFLSARPLSLAGALQGVCVCMQRVHARACVQRGQWGHTGGTRVPSLPPHPRSSAAVTPCAHGTSHPPHPGAPTLCPRPLRSNLSVWAPPKHSQPCAGAGLAAWCHGDPPPATASLQGPALTRLELCTQSWKGLRRWGLSQGMLLGLAQRRQSPAEPWGPSP